MSDNERVFKEALLDALRAEDGSARDLETLREALSCHDEARFRAALLGVISDGSEEIMALYVVESTLLRSWHNAQRLALEALAERHAEIVGA